MTTSQDDLLRSIEALTVVQLIALTRSLEQRLGMSVAVPPPRPPDGPSNPPGYFTESNPPPPRVELIDAGPNKLHVVMFLRTTVPDFAKIPIAKSKKLVDTLPMEIPIDFCMNADSTELRYQLKRLGAKTRQKKDDE